MIRKVQTDVVGQRTRLRSRNARLYSDNRSSPSFFPKRVRISVLNQAASPASSCPAPRSIPLVRHADHTGGWRRTLGVRAMHPARSVDAEPPTPNPSSCVPFNEHGPSRHALHCITVRVWRMRRGVGRDPARDLRRSRASPPLARPVSNKLGVCQTQTERSVAHRLPFPSFQHLTVHHGRQCRAPQVRV